MEDWEVLLGLSGPPAPGTIDPRTGQEYPQPSLGGALTPTPVRTVPYGPTQPAAPPVQPQPPVVPGAPVDLAPPSPGPEAPAAAPGLATAAAASGNDRVGQMANMLRGIVAPKPPDVQKVGTPALPAPRAVPPPKLVDLLRLYGLGGGAQPGQRPLTLGQALGGR